MIATSTVTLGSEEGPHFSIAKVERFTDDSGWRGLLTIRSGSFALIGHSFYFDDLLPFRDQIRLIYRDLEGSATLRPRYEYDSLEVVAASRGHVVVRGHFETYTPETHKLDLEFVLDQTFLPPLISSLDRVIQETQSEQATAGNRP